MLKHWENVRLVGDDYVGQEKISNKEHNGEGFNLFFKDEIWNYLFTLYKDGLFI